MIITLTILALTALFFAIGKIRSDVVALCSLILLLLFGILTPAEALAGFSNQVVIMMVGLFVVGGAIFQTGLAKMISGRIMRLAGTSELALFLLIIVVTSVIGAFVSNTGTVALMLPIVVSLAASARIPAARLLMPLAFASSMGGMLTLIGTPPNLVIQDALVESGHQPLGFFSFLPVGVVCIAVGIVVLLPLSRWLLGRRPVEEGRGSRRGKSPRQLVSEYRLADRLACYQVAPHSPLAGRTIGDIDLHHRYGLSLLELRRERGHKKGLLKQVEQRVPGPGTRLRAGDMLYLAGTEEDTARFVADYGLTPLSAAGSAEDGGMAFYDIGLAELVLLPSSRFVNRLLSDTPLRAQYHINVVGIRRRGEYLMEGLAQTRLHAGDVLLVQGTWDNIGRLGNDEDRWVVLGQPAAEAARVTLDYKAPVAACVMLLMIALMVFDFIPVAPVTAVMLAAVLMVLTGCFKNVEAAYKTINWESIVLIAAMMPMSVALEKTGASSLLSHGLVQSLGDMGPLPLLAGIYFATSLLTMFISNTATAVLMAPIAMASAAELGLSPYPFLFAVAVAASMCFASPFSTPPNALVMQAGRYTFMDYVRVGLPLQVIMGLVMVGVLPLIFPF